MNRLTPLLLVLSLSACAGAPRETALKIAAASDTVADELAAQWEPYVDRQIATCRAKNLPTPDERATCLGVAARAAEVEAAAAALVAAQTAVVIAAKCEVNPLTVPAEFKDKCGAADWAALRDAIVSAWDAIVPFFNAIKE